MRSEYLFHYIPSCVVRWALNADFFSFNALVWPWLSRYFKLSWETKIGRKEDSDATCCMFLCGKQQLGTTKKSVGYDSSQMSAISGHR